MKAERNESRNNNIRFLQSALSLCLSLGFFLLDDSISK